MQQAMSILGLLLRTSGQAMVLLANRSCDSVSALARFLARVVTVRVDAWDAPDETRATALVITLVGASLGFAIFLTSAIDDVVRGRFVVVVIDSLIWSLALLWVAGLAEVIIRRLVDEKAGR